MDCAEAKLQIEPYVAGEIPADAKSALEEHLGACAECRLDVELTRASRNTPPDPAPETPPALVEPMDPGGSDAAGTPAEDGAAGEASGATARATTPGGESWTLDSIFGSGGSTKGPGVPPVFAESGEESGAEPSAESGIPEPPQTVSPKESLGLDVKPAAGARPATQSPVGPAPVEPAPVEPEPPSRPVPVFATSADEALPPLLTPAPPKKSDEAPPSDAPSWDFEPVESNGKAKPPEGSLFFAKEALARGTPRKKGSPAARLALWAGGGVLGVGLLAASIWIALTMHPPLPPAVHGTRSERTDGLAQVGEPGTPAAPPVAPVDSTAAAGAGPASASAASAPAAPSATAPLTAPATPATTPGASAAAPSSTGPATAQESAARAVSPASMTDQEAPAHVRAAARTPVAKTGTSAGHGGHGTAITKTMSKSEALARADTIGKDGARARTAKAGGNASARAPAPRADNRSTTVSAAPKSTESASQPQAETSPPVESPASDGTSSPESGKTEPDATAKTAAPAPDAAGTPAGTSSPEESVERPIDRIHLATLAAEQNADLPGLRKMRDTWHGFLKTSLGPDRARAKRELADCLWAIQTLTSKTSDQKEALAAYRDYVLNAPAGGADARTVARMRQLEDALTESH
ncbi:MAG: zf-HC2 domain-containing protein [Bacteroidota bacterium]